MGQSKPVRRMAIVHPMSDFGINQYVYEVAEGVAAAGVEVDVYTGGQPELPPPVHHRRFCVLGSILLKQASTMLHPPAAPPTPPASLDWVERTLRMQPLQTNSARPQAHAAPASGWKQALREQWMKYELPAILRLRGYDTVWTQWPTLGAHGSDFWRLARQSGMHVVHSVHNVLPHEEDADSRAQCVPAYESAQALVVHSDQAAGELQRIFPEYAHKAIRLRHGIYTIYPHPAGSRERVREQLNIAPGQRAVLCCGAIRPYKNIDDSVAALREPDCENLILVVAGQEAHFPDCSALDPLAHTRALAQRLGVEDRVRLLPRSLSLSEMAELFTAGDIALLPYLQGYGSGMLLLAMTFGLHVVSSRVGGAEEYLKHYPAHSLLNAPDAEHIGTALKNVTVMSSSPVSAELQWTNIARKLLEELAMMV